MDRRSLRLRAFDYSSTGHYFVTACSRERACVFGVVVDEDVVLSSVGVTALDCLVAVPKHHIGVALDSCVVMPNHVHALVVLDESSHVELGDVVGTYKAAVSRLSRRASLWQRGYHDHVVRDAADLERIRDYIATNPIRWSLDPENPNRQT